jgi:hypothetical protein
MKYGESIGFVTGKMKKVIADFNGLGFFIAIYMHDLSKKTFRLSRAGVTQNLSPAYSLPLKS